MSDMVYMRIYTGKNDWTGNDWTGIALGGVNIRDSICCIFVNNNNNNNNKISCITSPTFEAYTRRSTA